MTNYDEEMLALLILSVVDEQLREIGFPKEYLPKTKLHKIIYDVADELDLEITRSWYLRGKYVWGAQDPISQFFNPSANLNFSENVFEMFGLVKSTVENAVAKALRKFNVLITQLNDYLTELYRHDAPEEYRELYMTHISLKERFEELLEEMSDHLNKSSILHYLGTPSMSVDYFSNIVVKYHMELSKLGDVADPVIEYTTLIDELLVGAEEKLNKNELTEEHIEFLRTTLDYYDNTVWKLPATYVAEKTMKGPKKHNIIKKLRSQREELTEKIEVKTYELEEKASEIDIFPSEKYLAERTSWDESSREYLKLMRDYLLG